MILILVEQLMRQHLITFHHCLLGFLESEVSPTLVAPVLWPAPDPQDSAYRLVTRVT